MSVTVFHGNCKDVMQRLLEENVNVDSVVTDPPYEIGFMGKEWDRTGIAYDKEMWELALQLLKPGGHLLSFGGSRTYHRMACAVEDAGFEIRDQIMWIYGTGFPKSVNISKALEKKGHLEESQKFEGWGTASKPAHEPIIVARKPLSEKTVAENVLKYGTGGINIDDSRVSYNGDVVSKAFDQKYKTQMNIKYMGKVYLIVFTPLLIRDDFQQILFMTDLMKLWTSLLSMGIEKVVAGTSEERYRINISLDF